MFTMNYLYFKVKLYYRSTQSRLNLNNNWHVVCNSMSQMALYTYAAKYITVIKRITGENRDTAYITFIYKIMCAFVITYINT